MKDNEIRYLVDLEERCPVDLRRLVEYANFFNSKVGVKISSSNITKAKRSLIEAKGYLDLMIVTLNQLLYDRKILRGNADIILHKLLMENLGMYTKEIDDQEKELLIMYDGLKNNPERIGISRLSAYKKLLKIAYQSVVFESLTKATEEYEKVVEGKEISETEILKPDMDKDGKQKIGTDGNPMFTKEIHKNIVEIKKNPRTFLYIFFQVLQITLFTLGSLERRKQSGSQFQRKDSISNTSVSWRQLLSQEGQKNILESHKEETGVDLPPELRSESQPQEEDGETTYTEESEEEAEEKEEEEGEEHV